MLKVFQKYLRPEQYQQERRLEAELAYRAQERSFQRYAASLSGTIDRFRHMAADAERQGRHNNALRAARFTRLLDGTLTKVESVRQHFEMLHAMSGASDIMVEFMDACKRMGCNLTETIDLDALSSSELSLEQGLSRLNFLSDKIEQAFETMENSLGVAEDDMTADPEDERLLAEICGIQPPADEPDVPAEPPVEPAPAQPLPETVQHTIDDLSQRLDALAN